MEQRRMDWVDGMKFLAILWIFCGHYNEIFDGTFYSALRHVGGGYLFRGVTGKMCVALFCVFLGFFCAKTGRNRQRDPVEYIFRRYVYFFLWMVAALGLICLIAYLDRGTRLTRYRYIPVIYGPVGILMDSVQLRSEISATYWCVQPFAIASVAVVVLNRKNASILTQLLIAGILYTGRAVWVMNCIFGSVLYCLTQSERTEKIAGRWYVRLALVLAAFFLIKRKEDYITYTLDGIAMTLVCLAVYYSHVPKKVLGFRPMAALGRYSMGVYMLHMILVNSVGKMMNGWLEPMMEVKWASLLTGAVCFFGCFPFAWALEKLITWLTGKLSALPWPLTDRASG